MGVKWTPATSISTAKRQNLPYYPLERLHHRHSPIGLVFRTADCDYFRVTGGGKKPECGGSEAEEERC